MRILISAVGTRGDVQPALALALAARAIGHDVSLCVPPNFTAWAAGLGFPARPIGVEMRPLKPGEPPPAIPDLIADQFATVAAAAEDCEIIVGAGLHQYAVRSVAERLGARAVIAAYAPVSLDPSADERGRWNARVLERLNAGRARLGLPPIADVLDHILGEEVWLAADPGLGPAPPRPGVRIVQTGAWTLADAARLPPELDAFLAAGEAPVYLGFGSMPAAPDTGAILVEAAREVGRRIILARGWADLQPADAGDDCLAVGDVNHAALFPRVAAVVHHGGAGTTTAAALAGAPQVVAPMFADQFYWAGRVAALGLGAALPPGGLAAPALAQALAAALGPAVAERARAFAPQVRADGAAVAARRLTEPP